MLLVGSINYHTALHGILLSWLGWCYQPLLENVRQATKTIFRTVGLLLGTSLESLARRQILASLSLFCRYYCGRCSSNWLNWFHILILVGGLFVILIGCMIFLSPFLDVTRMTVKSFFPGKARLLNSVPMECFYWPMTSLWRGSSFAQAALFEKNSMSLSFKDMHVFKGQKLEQLPPLYHWSTEAHLLWAYGCPFEAICLRKLSTTGLCLASEDCTYNVGQNILGKFWKLTH